MEVRIYPYLGEHRIAIDAPENVLRAVEGNLDEDSIKGESYEGMIKVREGLIRTIVRDRSFPYLSISENRERGIDGWNFVRYDTLIQTIWQIDRTNYEVRNNLIDDESGALKCFKKVYYALPGAKNKMLIHSAAVSVDGKGVLMVGRKRSGKTTLSFSFIDKMGADLVEGGVSLISFGESLGVYYLPRPIFARFSTISESDYLRSMLYDLNLTESNQPWDIEGIKEVVARGNFSIDGGLNFSRRAFRNLSGNATLPFAEVKTIVFPNYSECGKVKLYPMEVDEAYKIMRDREFKKDESLNNIKDQDKNIPPELSIISPEKLEGLKLVGISFDGSKSLSNDVLEDLLA